MKKKSFFILAILLLFFDVGFAQEPDNILNMDFEQLLDMEIVSATKTSQKISEAPAVIAVMTKQEIKDNGYKNVAEAIQRLAGIDMLYDGLQYNTGIRGINGGMRAYSKIMKVMIDGQSVSYRPSSENWLGEELIPISLVERIEVVRGPASALYGANAFLGVVNIITKKGEDIKNGSLSVYHQVGENFTGTAGEIVVGNKLGEFDFVLGATYGSYDRSGSGIQNVPNRDIYTAYDITENTKATPRSFFAKLELNNEKTGMLKIDMNYQQLSSYAEYQDWGTLTHNNYVSLNNYYIRLSNNKQLNEKLILNSGISYAAGGPTSDDKLDTDAKTDDWVTRETGYVGINVNTEVNYSFLEKNSITIGADYSTDNIDLLTHYYNDSTGAYTAMQHYTSDSEMYNNIGVFAQSMINPASFIGAQGAFERFNLTLGLRYDIHNIYGNSLNYRLGGVYQVSDKIYTKLLYGTSFKAPASTQLYSNYIALRGVIGNADLKPEKAKTVEWAIGMLPTEHIKISTNIFYSIINDKVELVLPIAEASNVRAENVANINSAGFELEGNANYAKIDAYLNYSFQQSIIEENTPLRGTVRLKTNLAPNSMFKFGMGYKVPSILRLSIDGRYISSRIASQINSFVSNPVNYLTDRYELSPYFIMDFAVSSNELKIFKDNETLIMLKVRNLLNTDYAFPGFKNYDIPGMKRTVELKLTQNF